MNKVLFTSESVTEGHPDKICDQISDAVLDAILEQDKFARVACETVTTTGMVMCMGEISTKAKIDIPKIVRDVVIDIGYDRAKYGFDGHTCAVMTTIDEQSPDIAMGVNEAYEYREENDESDGLSNGAGDQGIMFGYAKKEKGFDSNYMPLAIYWANRILQNLSNAGHNGEVIGIEPDAKSQVTLEYDNNGTPIRVKTIVLSTQHHDSVSQETIREIAKKYIAQTLPDGWMPTDDNILVNPTGRFVIGGPDGDTGLTGRKIIVDTYGGYAPHGGGAFSGKDPTKVDRSAAYMLCHLAKNIVAAGLAEECLLQISYAIGLAEPLSLYINTNHTNKVEEQRILDFIQKNIDLTPKGIINYLNLRRPIYQPTAAYGHFGRKPEDNGTFSWEKLNLTEQMKSCF